MKGGLQAHSGPANLAAGRDPARSGEKPTRWTVFPLNSLAQPDLSVSDRRAIAAGHYGPLCFEDVLRWVAPADDLRRDVMRTMLRDFVVGLDVGETITPGPRLFVSNHQMASDVAYFSFLIAGLSQQRADIVTWDGHHDLDAGQMNRWLVTHPAEPGRGLNDTIRPRLVDQRDARAVRGLARTIAGRMVSEADSVAFLCVGGETERQEGEPMTRMGGAFLDIVQSHQVPLTPARFNWGSTDGVEGRNMWSKHLAPQLFVTGPSLEPGALSGLSRPAQRDLVTEAINALTVPRPAGHFEAARIREARVRWLADMAGMGLSKAIFCDGLFRTPVAELSETGRLFLRWATLPGAADAYPGETWFYRFARWLSDGFGPARLDLAAKYPELAAAREACAF